VSWNDRRLDALKRRVDKFPPVLPLEDRRQVLHLTVVHPASGTAEQVRDYVRRANAAAWRAARTLPPDGPGLFTAWRYEPWDDPVLVADDVEPPTRRARLSLARPPALKALPAPPPPADDAAYCQGCGFRWTTEPRPVDDPCPAGCGRTRWGPEPPPRGPVGGFAFTL
jgi:hypothetical protein